jgi:hypothetical protein
LEALSEDLPPRPIRPRPDECCNSGCVRCIFDVYQEALAEWERQVAARDATAAPPEANAKAS